MQRIVVAAMCVICLAATETLAAADIGFKGIGARLSFVSPDGRKDALGFGAIVDLGTFTPEIGFQGTVDYWSSGENRNYASWDWSDFSFGARAVYTFKTSNAKLKPSVAGGLAFHRFSFSYDPEPVYAFAGVPGDDSEIKLGADLTGGIGYAVKDNMDIIGEVMYRIVSDISQFVISGGFVYWFGE